MESITQVGEMKVVSNLPPHIRSFSYVKNHHYIELEDSKGNRHRVVAADLLKGMCKSCHYTFYSENNHGDLICPACKNRNVEWTWGKLQLCFIPEKESDFTLEYPPKDEQA